MAVRLLHALVKSTCHFYTHSETYPVVLGGVIHSLIFTVVAPGDVNGL